MTYAGSSYAGSPLAGASGTPDARVGTLVNRPVQPVFSTNSPLKERYAIESAPAADAVSSPTLHVRTAADTVDAVTDANTSAALLIRTGTDTAPAVDDGTRQPLALARTGADDISGLNDDAAVLLALRIRTADDDVSGISDAASRVGTFGRTPTDTATPTDSVSSPIVLFRSASDDVSGLTDAATRLGTPYARDATDLAPADDATVRLDVLSRSASDDVSGLTDSSVRAIVLLRAGADDVSGLTDVTTRVNSSFARDAADTAPADDAATRSTTSPRTAPDSIAGTTDSVASSAYQQRAGDEDLSFSTSGGSAMIRPIISPYPGVEGPLSVSPGTNDWCESFVSQGRITSDSAPADDAVVRDPLLLLRGGTDTAPASDAATRTGPFFRTGSDTAPAIDDGTRLPLVLARATTEDISGLTDSADRSDGVFARDTTDDAPAADAVVSLAIQYRTAADTVAAPGESIADVAGLFRTAADSAPAFDTLTLDTALLYRTAANTAPSDDAVASYATQVRSGSEDLLDVPDDTGGSNLIRPIVSTYPHTSIGSSGTRDIAERSFVGSRAIDDDISGTTDSVASFAIAIRTAADTVPASDVATRVASTFSRAVTDDAPADDAAIQTSVQGRFASDSPGATSDSVDSPVFSSRTGADDLSLGDEMVLNGDASAGLTNFSAFASVVDGGFRTPIVSGSIATDQAVPIRSGESYRLSAEWRGDPATGQTHYICLDCFDNAGLTIESHHSNWVATGTLAVDLKPGDTTFTLTDATGWYQGNLPYRRTLLLFPYIDSKGYRHEFDGSGYSRNVLYDATNGGWIENGIVGNVVTLTVPFALSNPDHPLGWWPAGTKVVNSTAGNTYVYPFSTASNGVVPAGWTSQSVLIGSAPLGASSIIRPGTRSAKFRFLTNRGGTAGAATIYRNLSIRGPGTSDAVVATTLHLRTIGDDAPASDDSSRLPLALARDGADTVSATSDTAVRTAGIFGRTPTDTAPATDTTAGLSTLARDGVEDISVQPDPYIGSTIIRPIVATYPDSGIRDTGTRDYAERNIIITRDLADTAPADDTVASYMLAPRSVAESAPASDAAFRVTTYARALSEDTSALDDAVLSYMLAPRAVSDSAPANDDPTVPRDVWQYRTGSDSAPATDDGVRTPLTLIRFTANDLADFPESTLGSAMVRPIVSPYPRQMVETGGTRDIAERSIGQARDAVDTAPASDVLTSGAVIYRTASDSAPAVDSVASYGVQVRDGVEDISDFPETTLGSAIIRPIVSSYPRFSPATDGVFDIAEREIITPRTTSDSAPAADTLTHLALHICDVSDSAPASDALTHLTTHDRFGIDDLSDLPESTDGSALIRPVVSPYPRFAPETDGTFDIAERIVITPREVADSVPAADDSLFSQSLLYRTPTDDAPAIDDGTRLPLALARWTADDLSDLPEITGGSAIVRPILSTYPHMSTGSTGTRDIAERFVIQIRSTADTAPVVDTVDSPAIHPRTAADSAPATDAVASLALQVRYAAEDLSDLPEVTDGSAIVRPIVSPYPHMTNGSTGTRDIAERLVIHIRDLAEDVSGVNDSVLSTALLYRAITDAAPADDAAVRTILLARTLIEDISGLSDAAVRSGTFARALSDLAPADDAAVRALSLFWSVADSVAGISDAATRSLTVLRAITDNASSDDTAIGAYITGRTASDTVTTPSDAVGRIQWLVRQPGDDAPAVDDGTRQPITFARAGDDDISAILDAATRSGTFSRALDDAASADDAVTSSGIHLRTAADTALADDAVASMVSLFRSGADNTATNDTADRSGTFARTPADTAPAADSPTSYAIKFVTAADTAPVTEAADRLVQYDRSSTDDAPVGTDVALKSLVLRPRFATDVGWLPNATDYAIRAALLLPRSAADSAPATDDSTRIPLTLARAGAEILPTLADDAVRGATYLRALDESTPASDSLSVRGLRSRMAADSLSLADAATQVSQRLREAADFVTIPTDKVTSPKSTSRTAGDVLTISDVASPRSTQPRVASDVASAFDLTAIAVVDFNPRIAPRVRTLAVGRIKVSLVTGYDSCAVDFTFDQPVEEWVVRVGSTSHLDGDLVEHWSAGSSGPAIAGSLVIPASMLRRGSNQISIYGKSVVGVWSR